MDEDDVERALRDLEQMHHGLRLGIDAMSLLYRCFDECDMSPDLATDVGTLLLRFAAHIEHMKEQRGRR